jgi:hypothetical protein
MVFIIRNGKIFTQAQTLVVNIMKALETANLIQSTRAPPADNMTAEALKTLVSAKIRHTRELTCVALYQLIPLRSFQLQRRTQLQQTRLQLSQLQPCLIEKKYYNKVSQRSLKFVES